MALRSLAASLPSSLAAASLLPRTSLRGRHLRHSARWRSPRAAMKAVSAQSPPLPSSPSTALPCPPFASRRSVFYQNCLISSRFGLPKSVLDAPQRRAFASSSENTLTTVLNDAQASLLREEQDMLKNALNVLEAIGASKEDVKSMKTALEQLEDLFLLVVVGEFNSGKSSFLNALLGAKKLDEGVTPTTSHIDILRFGDKFAVGDSLAEDDHRRIVRMPVPWLKEISLVDTPGTNAVFQAHQQITEHFVPRSDLVLWVTSVDRPFSESERKFLSQVEQFRKKVVVIISKIDLVETVEEREKIVDFVKTQFKAFLGNEPIVFPVSSKKALKAKIESQNKATNLAENSLWKESQFYDLENYILKTLSSEERAWLKLRNPLGVTQHVVQRYLSAIDTKIGVLADDIALLERINKEMDEHREDMKNDFKFHLDRIDNVLLRFSERGNEFLNDKISLTNIFELIKSDKLKRDFEDQVVAETGIEIERHVNEMVDWILQRNAKQWERVVESIQLRAQLNSKNLIGSVRTSFEYNRDAVLKDISFGAQKVFGSYDKKTEAALLNSSVRNSLYQTVAIEVGALGLGGVLSSSFFDISGVLPASAIAITGLGVLPIARSRIIREFRGKIEELRKKMSQTLEEQFAVQLENGIQKIQENTDPYTRFVKTEQTSLSEHKKKLEALSKQATSLGEQVDTAFTKK